MYNYFYNHLIIFTMIIKRGPYVCMCKKLYKCSCFIEVREHKRSLPIITGCQDFFALGRNFNLSPLFRRRHRRLFQKRPHLLGARNWRGGRPIFIGTNQSHINQSLGPTPREHFFSKILHLRCFLK